MCIYYGLELGVTNIILTVFVCLYVISLMSNISGYSRGFTVVCVFPYCILPLVSFASPEIDGTQALCFPVSRIRGGSWILPPGFPSRRIRAAHCVNCSCTCAWKCCYSPRIRRRRLLVHGIPQHTHVYARWSTCVASISIRSTPLETPSRSLMIAWAIVHCYYPDMVLVYQRLSTESPISIGNITHPPRKAISAMAL